MIATLWAARPAFRRGPLGGKACLSASSVQLFVGDEGAISKLWCEEVARTLHAEQCGRRQHLAHDHAVAFRKASQGARRRSLGTPTCLDLKVIVQPTPQLLGTLAAAWVMGLRPTVVMSGGGMIPFVGCAGSLFMRRSRSLSQGGGRRQHHQRRAQSLAPVVRHQGRWQHDEERARRQPAARRV